ncbi:MAG TPA: NAD(P)-binding domain-containing protein [Alphaproteobacteria bacterium]|nr:NAD(P)-binding domain-containing protein [Alphaproteobacteria bacterium]
MADDPILRSIFPCNRRGFLALAAGGAALGAVASAPFAARAQGASAAKPKLATIGAGREGGALGTLFAKAGYPVMFSSLHPETLKPLVAAAGPTAKAGSVAQAVAFGEVVLLVVPYTAVESIGQEYGKALAAKPLVIDVSNPIARRDGDAIVTWVNAQGGAGLATAKLIPGAHLVRAFNAIGAGRLAPNAHRAGAPLGIPIAGDDPKALALAERLIKDVGFEPVPIGGLAMGRYLVPGTPLAGEHTPDEIRTIVATLKP